MNNQTELREIAVKVLNVARGQFPDVTFFIRRRSNRELSVCGFLYGSIDPESVYFTVDNETLTALPGTPSGVSIDKLVQCCSLINTPASVVLH